jgi:predicted RNA-binding protein with RPS1 domain
MEKYKIGDYVSGNVTGITNYGIFIKLDDGYTGLIHISEVSDKFVSSIEKMYVLDETIDANIIEIDEEKKQIKLSIKEFTSKKNRRRKIKEEGRGFEPLKEHLDEWIKEKLEDIKNNKQGS